MLLHQIKGDPILSKEAKILSCHGLKLPGSRLKTSTRQTSLHFLVSRSIKVKYHIGTKKNTKNKKRASAQYFVPFQWCYYNDVGDASGLQGIRNYLRRWEGSCNGGGRRDDEQSALTTTLPHPGKHCAARRTALASGGRWRGPLVDSVLPSCRPVVAFSANEKCGKKSPEIRFIEKLWNLLKMNEFLKSPKISQ